MAAHLQVQIGDQYDQHYHSAWWLMLARCLSQQTARWQLRWQLQLA
jgi:hypothetical protein